MKSKARNLLMFASKHIFRLFLVQLFALNLAFAGGLPGQSLENTRVTLQMEEASLVQIFGEIEGQTDFTFGYDENVIDSRQRLTLNVEDETLRSALNHISAETDLAFRRINGTISVTKKERSDKKEQTGSVSGTVTEAETGEPLPGVNVVVKGTTRGASTDKDGNYSVAGLEPGNYTLRASYIGYEPVEREVAVYDTETTAVNFVMQRTTGVLGEVEVNAGYWSVKDRERTGNISRVTSDAIGQQPVSNLLQALQGRMPGVEVVQRSGVPGAGMSIQIRGRNSMRFNANYPLYVIDGVPVSSEPIRSEGGLLGRGDNYSHTGIDPLNTLDPANIESIEILKDADATAIYGSRGANGVVLITTKKGTPGETSLDISMQTGAGRVSNMIDLLNTEQYLEMRQEAFANDGVAPTASNAPDLLVWDSSRDVDWQEELFGGTAHYTDLRTSVSGGNDQTSYRFGGSIHRETTVFPGDSRYNKVAAQFNLNHTSSDQRFRMSLSTNYGIDNNRLFGYQSSSFVEIALKLPPNAPSLYDEEGNLNWAVDSFGVPRFDNPVAQLEQIQKAVTHNLVSSATISYEIVPGLQLKSNIGYTDLRLQDIASRPKSANRPGTSIPSQTIVANQTRNSWIIEPQLVYQHNFEDARLDVLVGMSWQENSSTRRGFRGEGYSSEELLGSLDAAAETSLAGESDDQYKYNAIFGRIGYNWKQKYLVNLTGRRDGSSRFAPDRQFANFGAVGAAWVFSEEDLIADHLPFLSFGKLRASYGTSGSDQIGDYGFLNRYSPISLFTVYRGEGGLDPSGLANSDYRWELNRKLEVAIDLGFIQDRIFISASWYRNRSSNQLVGLSLPAITGFTSVQANLPATVQNTGWELEVKTQNMRSGRFNWVSALNISVPRNELIEYPNLEGSPYASSYVIGEPLSIQRVYQWEGVDPATGVHQVEDITGDGLYNYDDRGLAMDRGRQYYGGLQNTFRYKRWELDFLLEFVKQKGASYRSSGIYTYHPGYFGPSIGNFPVEVMNRWKQPGDITDVQKFSQSFTGYYPYNDARNSDLGFVDASFIRLKNIALSYQIPSNNMINGKIYVRAQNLFTWTNYWGLDPQFAVISGRLPALKMITGGFQVKF